MVVGVAVDAAVADVDAAGIGAAGAAGAVGAVADKTLVLETDGNYAEMGVAADSLEHETEDAVEQIQDKPRNYLELNSHFHYHSIGYNNLANIVEVDNLRNMT